MGSTLGPGLGGDAGAEREFRRAPTAYPDLGSGSDDGVLLWRWLRKAGWVGPDLSGLGSRDPGKWVLRLGGLAMGAWGQ